MLLRRYQLQGLHWMREREKSISSNEDINNVIKIIDFKKIID